MSPALMNAAALADVIQILAADDITADGNGGGVVVRDF
jgi:hypothetical protein